MKLSPAETETYLEALERGLSEDHALALAVGAGPVTIRRVGEEAPAVAAPYTNQQAQAIVLRGVHRASSLHLSAE